MDEIPDDEILLRHIPGGTLWQAPGPRITSANFQLRHDRHETGISVTRIGITSPARLIELMGAAWGPESRLAAVRTADVRRLGLRVVSLPLPENPGHAEIQPGKESLDDRACRKRLSLLFTFHNVGP